MLFPNIGRYLWRGECICISIQFRRMFPWKLLCRGRYNSNCNAFFRKCIHQLVRYISEHFESVVLLNAIQCCN